MNKILLIDDDPLVLKSIAGLLNKKGYKVFGCPSGFEAITVFKREEVNLIVCDIRMAGQDGIQTVAKIRDLETNSDKLPIPIIMITGFAEPNTPIEALKIGVQDYFLKPFDTNVLLQSIERNLKQYIQRREKYVVSQKMVKFNVIGIGIVGPFGLTLDALWTYTNLCTTNFQKFKNSDFPKLEDILYTRVNSLNPECYFDEKQLHNLDRNSIFVSTAAKLAIENSGIKVSKIGSDKTGVSVGTSVSIATAMSDFDESVLRDGSRRSKIGIFPNTVMCAPASRVSIFEHITGSNTTISTGMNSGIDAVGYACFCLENDLAEVMIAGGSDAISEKILMGYQQEGLLFGSNTKEVGRNKRGAFVPSEGSCVVVMKRFDEKHPDTDTHCEILSYACGFTPFKRRDIEKRSQTLQLVAQRCLNEANLSADVIDCFLISSYFDELNYQAELRAIQQLLGGELGKKPLLAPKKILGESFAAYSPTLLALVVGLFKEKINQKAIEYLNENKLCVLSSKIQTALIIHSDPSGHESALILKSPTI